MREEYTFPFTVNKDGAATILVNFAIPAMMKVAPAVLDTQGLLANRSDLSVLPMEEGIASLFEEANAAETRASTRHEQSRERKPRQQKVRAAQTDHSPWLSSRENLPWLTAGRRTENWPQLARERKTRENPLFQSAPGRS